MKLLKWWMADRPWQAFAVIWGYVIVIVALIYFSTDQDNIGRGVYEAIVVALAVALIVSAGLVWTRLHGRSRAGRGVKP